MRLSARPACHAVAEGVVSWKDVAVKHVIDSQAFDVASMNLVFDVAEEMEKVRPGSPESKMLQGYVMATLFYEPSTRTRLSFEAAMGKLGGVILSTESAGEFSSAAKGETLQGVCTLRSLILTLCPTYWQHTPASRCAWQRTENMCSSVLNPIRGAQPPACLTACPVCCRHSTNGGGLLRLPRPAAPHCRLSQACCAGLHPPCHQCR